MQVSNEREGEWKIGKFDNLIMLLSFYKRNLHLKTHISKDIFLKTTQNAVIIHGSPLEWLVVLPSAVIIMKTIVSKYIYGLYGKHQHVKKKNSLQSSLLSILIVGTLKRKNINPA